MIFGVEHVTESEGTNRYVIQAVDETQAYAIAITALGLTFGDDVTVLSAEEVLSQYCGFAQLCTA